MSETDIAAFSPKSDFVRVMRDRGYIHQCSDIAALDAAAVEGVVPAYIGFDATATSLHVGSLIQIMLLRRLQRAGHKPIVVMGGGTTKVGDPSGKDTQRQMLTDAQIQENIQGILSVFDRFLVFGDGPTDAIVVDNDAWLSKFGYVEFLREFGPHFTINRMLTFDSVKLRLDREQPLTFLEFNYMLMQAVDYLQLSRLHGCRLQMGGSDQWGNIINGVDLIRRVDGKQAFALTTPLLTTASGAKMGKTASGAMWLNEDRMSPYDYWQFWRNTEDADVGKFMKLFTDLPLDEIARLESLPGAEINDAKKVLADEATILLHGAEAARAARAAAEENFGRGGISSDTPTTTISRVRESDGHVWSTGRSTAEIVFASGLVSSNSEARRKIAEGAVSIGDRKITNSAEIIPWTEVDGQTGAFKVQLGKKKIVLVKPA